MVHRGGTVTGNSNYFSANTDPQMDGKWRGNCRKHGRLPLTMGRTRAGGCTKYGHDTYFLREEMFVFLVKMKTKGRISQFFDAWPDIAVTIMRDLLRTLYYTH